MLDNVLTNICFHEKVITLHSQREKGVSVSAGFKLAVCLGIFVGNAFINPLVFDKSIVDGLAIGALAALVTLILLTIYDLFSEK